MFLFYSLLKIKSNNHESISVNGRTTKTCNNGWIDEFVSLLGFPFNTFAGIRIQLQLYLHSVYICLNGLNKIIFTVCEYNNNVIVTFATTCELIIQEAYGPKCAHMHYIVKVMKIAFEFELIHPLKCPSWIPHEAPF